jgi:hypothetical protein
MLSVICNGLKEVPQQNSIFAIVAEIMVKLNEEM